MVPSLLMGTLRSQRTKTRLPLRSEDLRSVRTILRLGVGGTVSLGGYRPGSLEVSFLDTEDPDDPEGAGIVDPPTCCVKAFCRSSQRPMLSLAILRPLVPDRIAVGLKLAASAIVASTIRRRANISAKCLAHEENCCRGKRGSGAKRHETKKEHKGHVLDG